MKFQIRVLFAFILITISLSCKSQIKSNYNFSFEQDVAHKPIGWRLYFGPQNDDYVVQLDSSVVKEGKYSLSISSPTINENKTFGLCSYSIPAKFSGRKIKLTGFLKTENVAGNALLWLRVDGKTKTISYAANTQPHPVQGTTDWKEYTVELPNSTNAQNIVIGASLAGSGKIWIDDFHLYIDDKPIESAPQGKFIDSSAIPQISSIELNNNKIKLLTNLGMIWGFLKYYHPAISAGKYNWDAELFKELPKILSESNNDGAYKEMEQWVNSLGTVPACKNCAVIQPTEIKLKPDYGYLFTPNNLPASLEEKLAFIRDNYKPIGSSYYIGFVPGIGNPIFKNELAYQNAKYPNVGVRLLALYRYWNIIQYFFPSRYLIGEDWNKVLTEFIPKFVNAKNEQDYDVACLEIIARIHDTHANIWSYSEALNSAKGIYMTPFQAKFIENKLVVINYYKDTLGVKNKIHIGDIIEKIDGVSVDSLIKKYLPLTPASNYATQLRDLPNGGLLRSNRIMGSFLVRRNNKELSIALSRVPIDIINRLMGSMNSSQRAGYKMLPNNIGYIYPAKLKKSDINSIEKEFVNTKGLIIDMRCYPSTFMPFTYGAWLKNISSPFAKFTNANLTMPGSIIWGTTISNGNSNPNYYKGKVVIIVNAKTQSQAEYTTMALSTAPNVKVIGSTTAGADGDVSSIILPGGISTWISGLGVYYPNGTETQRVGVKIDIPVKATIKGFMAGKDELLDKAIEIIKTQ